MKPSNKILSLLFIMVFVTVSLSGCAVGQATEAAGAAQVAEPTQATLPTDAPAPTQSVTETPATRTVTDMAGRTVTLPTEIKSVATFGSIGVLNAFVETLGQGSKICNEGSESFTKTESWKKYQYLFAPQLKDSPVFEDANREVMMETVLATNPDLSLTMSKELTEQLEAQGLNVIYLSWTKTEDVKTAIPLLGEVLNAQDVAADYLAYFDEKISMAAELTKDIKEEDKRTVLYGSISSLTQPHIIAEWWIPAAGGISVTGDVE
jgi:iron complex transport system substrate-binding protein